MAQNVMKGSRAFLRKFHAADKEPAGTACPTDCHSHSRALLQFWCSLQVTPFGIPGTLTVCKLPGFEHPVRSFKYCPKFERMLDIGTISSSIPAPNQPGTGCPVDSDVQPEM